MKARDSVDEDEEVGGLFSRTLEDCGLCIFVLDTQTVRIARTLAGIDYRLLDLAAEIALYSLPRYDLTPTNHSPNIPPFLHHHQTCLPHCQGPHSACCSGRQLNLPHNALLK